MELFWNNNKCDMSGPKLFIKVSLYAWRLMEEVIVPLTNAICYNEK